MRLDWLFFWNHKAASDNDWHPEPGANPIKYVDNLPPWAKRIDVEAATVDVAPLVCGTGALAHIRQLNSLGWTVPASIFRNKTTMMAMHRTVLYLTPLMLLCQACGFEYRYLIPRWSHDRERRREEEEVRKHVDVGLGTGAVSWALRMYVFGAGRAYWAPLDVIMGGALSDLMHREYVKAHGF